MAGRDVVGLGCGWGIIGGLSVAGERGNRKQTMVDGTTNEMTRYGKASEAKKGV